MKLKNVAKFFDRLAFSDAYDPAVTFKGQFDVYDDSKRDGLTVERRIISVSPDVVIPTRKTVTADGVTWILGDVAPDYFKKEAIRHKYVAHLSQGLATVKTFQEALAGSAGLAAHASRVWIKGSKEIEESSDVVEVYDIYFAPDEPIQEGHMVLLQGQWHLVRSVYPSAGGFRVVVADHMDNPLVTCTFIKRKHEPRSDTFTSVRTSVNAISLRWQSHFSYPVKAADKYQPGDMVLVVLKSAVSATAGDKVELSGTTYNVVAVADEGTALSLHLRNA